MTSVDLTFTSNHEFRVSNRFARWWTRIEWFFCIYVTMTDIPIIFACQVADSWRHKFDLWRYRGDTVSFMSTIHPKYSTEMHQNTKFYAELNGEHAGEGFMPLRSIVLEICIGVNLYTFGMALGPPMLSSTPAMVPSTPAIIERCRSMKWSGSIRWINNPVQSLELTDFTGFVT